MELQIVETTLGVTRDLIAQDVKGLDSEEQERWLVNIGNCLTGWGHIRNCTIMAEAEILYRVYVAWNDESITYQVKDNYDYDFYNWAKQFTKRNQNEQTRVTINNKVTVYRDWVAKPTIDYPQDINPLECDYGKLLVSRATAKKGGMSQEAWEILRDSRATVRQLKEAISIKNINTDNELVLFESDGFIMAYNGTETVALMQILKMQNKFHSEALKAVMKRIGVEPSLWIVE